jgi:hypothetical protein
LQKLQIDNSQPYQAFHNIAWQHLLTICQP